MTRQQLVLAFDTASDVIAMAIGRLSAVDTRQSLTDTSQPLEDASQSVILLATADMPARREANTKLLPAVNAVLASRGFNKEEIACVVCGRGPGSFTGVRIAVATAKGIASGLEVPLFGVPTCDAQAWQIWQAGVRGKVAILTDAMRGEIYPAYYLLNEQGAQRSSSLTVIKAEALAQAWQANQSSSELLIAGDALYKYGELFGAYAWLDEQHWHPQGKGLLKAFEAQPRDSGKIASLLPIYTRLSDAEENERKRLAAGGQTRLGALTDVPPAGVASPLQMHQPAFRPAALGDIKSMAALEVAANPGIDNALSGELWTEAMYLDELGVRDRSWWVCYQDDVLVGFAGGQLIDGCLHVLDLVVDENHRRRGIALQLLQHLIEDAKDLGATGITLEVRVSNRPARQLYTKLGLEEVGKRPGYYSPRQAGDRREDAIIMSADLGAIGNGFSYESKTDWFRANWDTVAADASAEDSAETADAAAEDTAETADVAADTVSSNPEEHPLILAIESSCDETAAALINRNGQLLSNVVASQTDFHARFGGVVPEIASRKHTEAIYPVVMEAMANRRWQDLDAVAVTYAPGLIGALVVGLAFAKGLSWAIDVPLIKVDHMEGHIYANRFSEHEGSYRIESGADSLRPPFLIALLSGGNTMLVSVRAWGEYQVLGETLDDAVGEAYDKVAKALGLGYPGGPIIAKLAAEGNPQAFAFPRALLHSGDYRFSLSGLKTAVLTEIRQQQAAGTLSIEDIAAAFEQAVIDVQVAKALAACKSLGVNTFCIGGGVAANKALRKAYQTKMEPQGIQVRFPPMIACTDNAAMIAAVALDRYSRNRYAGLEDDAFAHSSLESTY